MDALISLRGIRKTCGTGPAAAEILHGIDLDIYPGEFVAITGSSGSGKSTLMYLLGCLDRPSAGHYYFAGRDTASLNAEDLAVLRRDAFGFIFQNYHLIGTDSARQNVEIPGIYAGMSSSARRRRAEELLRRLGLGERLEHRPGELSGGQQQRVSIARALMNGGRVILADEPTGALDSHSGRQVMALLSGLAEQGHTVILITHDPKVAAQARRQIEVRDGKVVSDTGPVPGGTALLPALAQPRHAPWTEFVESTRMAVRALRMNLFRTSLTLLGIMIGVASVVAMLAIGEGAKHQVLERINAMGSNLLMIRPEGRGRFGADGVLTLVEEDAQALASVPNVVAVLPELPGQAVVRANSHDLATQIVGTDSAYSRARNWPVESGFFFDAQDQKDFAAVAVLGRSVAEGLFPGADPVGRFLMINNVPFRVLGVMSEKGATGWGADADNVVFVPLSSARLRLFGVRGLRSITVAVDDGAAMHAVRSRIEAVLRDRHGSDDFRIRNMADVVETATATQNTLTILLGSIAAISLLVGGIGVMNIMLVSVSERVHEIGIRMATGARTRNILQQFLTEAVSVSALGGALGVVAGVALGQAGNLAGMPALFSPMTMVLAFGCATGTGLLFGFTPALKAARMDPARALASD